MARAKQTRTLSGVDRALQIGMAAVGAVLLLGSIGVAVRGAAAPARAAFIEVVETERTVVGGRTRIQVEVINRGDRTASAVFVEATAAGRTAMVTVDHVPGLSRKTATLSLNGDPGNAPLTLEATGWVDP